MNAHAPFWRVALAFLALGACLAAFSCSPAEKYRVLSFLFDGVPAPAGVEPRPTRERARQSGETSAFVEGLQQLREQPRKKKEPVLLSVHKPVADGKCQECHDYEGDLGAVPVDARLCDMCHLEQRRREGWDHGPINLGTCIPCHVPHRSRHEHLLSKQMTELCLDCHVDTSPDDGEYHDVSNFADCTTCHDPHRMY